jgi:hypothetical protein
MELNNARAKMLIYLIENGLIDKDTTNEETSQ